MREVICPKDSEDDLSLLEYFKYGENDYEATFECRQCGWQFTVNLTEKELDTYK